MEKKRSLADELAKYADRSVYGIQRGAGEVSDLVRLLLDGVPPSVDDAAGMAAEFMPGYGTQQGMRRGAESGRLWRQGDYAGALDAMAEGVNKTSDDLFWLMPGAGLVPKVMR